MVRFDAYSATTTEADAGSMHALLRGSVRAGDGAIEEGKGFHTFGSRVRFLDDAGSEWAAFSFGGRQEGRVLLEVKGERTPEVVERLRSAFPHRCTRVDSCADFDAPGAFERLLEPVLRAKREFDLYGERRGDWEKPELGRTMYLGAPSSAIRARLYEKGKQPELRYLGRFDLARLEIQVRPAKEAKQEYATLSPLDVWGASKFTRLLAAEVLQEHLDAHPPGTIRRLATRDAAVRWMCRQYGTHLVGLAEDLGGWDCLGRTLRETVEEERRAQERERRLAAATLAERKKERLWS